MLMNKINIKKQLKFFDLLFFMITTTTLFLFPIKFANAGAYVMPISIEPGIGGQGLPRVTQEIIYWDEDEGKLNPCYGQSECWVGPDVLYSSNFPSLRGSCQYFNNCIEISKYRYTSQVMSAFKSAKGIPYRAIFDISSSDATCVGLFYITHKPINAVFDSKLWPGSTCGKLPPANQYCSVNLPAYIDHGAINSTNLNGQTKDIGGTIDCTQAANIKLYSRSTTGDKYIYLNNNKNFYSRTMINNKDGWNGVSISVSGNNISSYFMFTSELHTAGAVSPGYYTGNAIVIISFD